MSRLQLSKDDLEKAIVSGFVTIFGLVGREIPGCDASTRLSLVEPVHARFVVLFEKSQRVSTGSETLVLSPSLSSLECTRCQRFWYCRRVLGDGVHPL